LDTIRWILSVAKAGTFNAHVTHIKFAYTFSEDVAKEAGGVGGVMMFKTFDQKEHVVPNGYLTDPDSLGDYIVENR
jgi:hypothetical protein